MARQQAGPLLLITALIFALTLPTIFLTRAWSPDGESPNNKAAEPYNPSTSARSVSFSATATPIWAEAPIIRAPSWDGIVTSVLVKEGDTFESGATILTLDGLEIRYFSLATPLYAPACGGNSTLISPVRDILSASGFKVDDTPTLSATDLANIRAYAASIKAPNAKTVTCFDPGWVITGPYEEMEVDEISLAHGARAPALGEPIITGERQLEKLTVTTNFLPSGTDEDIDESFLASSHLIIANENTGIEFGELSSSDALAILSTTISADIDELAIALNVDLPPDTVIVPPTAVVDPLGADPCLEIAATGAPVHVRVRGSTLNGIVVEFPSRDALAPINPVPDISSCE